MKIIVSALHFAWADMDDCLRTVRDDFGIDGVELSLDAGMTRPHCTAKDLAELPELHATYGLTLDAHIWEDVAQLGPVSGAAALEGWLEVAVRAGIGGLVIHGGSYPDQEEGIARTRQTFERVMGRFERAGVVLKLENHYAYSYRDGQELFSEPWAFLPVLRAIDSASLRVCFDTGHGHMTQNWSALLHELAPYLAHVHLADNRGIDDDHLAYREGTVPWDDIFAILKAINFDGTYCVEFPVPGHRAAFDRCLADVRRLQRR